MEGCAVRVVVDGGGERGRGRGGERTRERGGRHGGRAIRETRDLGHVCIGGVDEVGDIHGSGVKAGGGVGKTKRVRRGRRRGRGGSDDIRAKRDNRAGENI